MRRTLHPANLLLFPCFLAGSAASADTHWVNLNGSNQPPYTSYATGAHSIQDAIDAAFRGDTVRVAAGIYDLDTTVFLKDSIAVIGAGRDSTVIMLGRIFGDYSSVPTLQLKGVSGSGGGGLTLNGCTIRCQKWGISPFGDGIVIRSQKTSTNHIVGNSFRYCKTAISVGRADVVVAHNDFDSNDVAVSLSFDGPYDIHDNMITGRPLPGGAICGAGIDAWNWLTGGPARIHHNTVFTCDGQGISASSVHDTVWIYNNLVVTEGPIPILLTAAGDGAVIMRNNTIVRAAIDTSWPRLVADFCPEPGLQMTVENNIFWAKNGTLNVRWEYSPGGTVRFGYNDLWGLDSGTSHIRGFDISPGMVVNAHNNLYCDPMFTRDTTYRLQRGSPLIDAGYLMLQDPDGSVADIGWTGGPEGIVYAYPEEPPKRPDTLIGQVSDQSVFLSWPRNTEADLAEYRVYRDAVPGFVPHAGNLLAQVASSDTCYADAVDGISDDLYYVLTAVDTTGLESPPSNEVAVIRTGILEGPEEGDALPRTPRILGSYPNPFNATTVIEFELPDIGARPTLVEVIIYDTLGRRIATLVGRKLYPGRHRAIWDGQGDHGTPAASGIYFARLVVWGHEFESTVKLVLEK